MTIFVARLFMTRNHCSDNWTTATWGTCYPSFHRLTNKLNMISVQGVWNQCPALATPETTRGSLDACCNHTVTCNLQAGPLSLPHKRTLLLLAAAVTAATI